MGFVYILYVVICALLVTVILFQDGKTGGLVSVPDSSQALFGAKGASSILSKVTSVLAVLFMVLSMFLAYSSGSGSKSIAADHVPQPVNSTNGAITQDNEDRTAEKPVAASEKTDEKGNSLEVVDDKGNAAGSTELYKKDDLPPEVRKSVEELEKRKQEKEKNKNN